jgi:hypothetical protein
MRRLLAVLFALLCAGATDVTADVTSETRVDAAGIQADIDVLQRAYEALHPGLCRYNTPETMRGHFAVLRAALFLSIPSADSASALPGQSCKELCDCKRPFRSISSVRFPISLMAISLHFDFTRVTKKNTGNLPKISTKN